VLRSIIPKDGRSGFEEEDQNKLTIEPRTNGINNKRTSKNERQFSGAMNMRMPFWSSGVRLQSLSIGSTGHRN